MINPWSLDALLETALQSFFIVEHMSFYFIDERNK